MPFGVKSHRDGTEYAREQQRLKRVTNAFRREVPSGQAQAVLTTAAPAPSPMPFGVKSHRDCSLRAQQDARVLAVTNAFRREVPSGPRAFRPGLRPRPMVTNAFRREVPSGRPGVKPFDFQDASTAAGREVTAGHLQGVARLLSESSCRLQIIDYQLFAIQVGNRGVLGKIRSRPDVSSDVA